MFISLAQPQVDMVWSGDNVFASSAAAAFAPWAFPLNQINAARFLNQGLRNMSFNPMSLRGTWAQAGLKQQPQQQPGLQVYGSGYYPVEPQGATQSVPVSATEGQSLTGSRTTRTPNATCVSQYSALAEPTQPNTIGQPSSANITAGPELLDPPSPCWQLVPPGPSTVPPFATQWEHAHHQAVNPPALDYGQFTLSVHTGMLPQTVFRPAEALHNMSSLAAVPEKDSAVSTNSKLYASSDMLEAMVLIDEPSQSSWSVPPPGAAGEYDGLPCADAAGDTDDSSSAWAGPPAAVDEETVSPKMLRLRSTPMSSCESIRTSFLAGSAANTLPRAETVPSQANLKKHSKARRQLPDRRQQMAPLNDDDESRRRHHHQWTARFDPPSPLSRKLSKLRPKPKLAAAPSTLASPSPLTSALPRLPGPLRPAAATADEACSRRGGRVDLGDRLSKDDFLVRNKQLGLTYKEIRRIGGFTEAESTLRGRYRTLTKSREARVRRPEWSEKDLRLLDRAVRELAHTSDPAPAKVPWKKVAEYIVAHGGTYHFGNSTCRKRWDELVREQAALGKSVRAPFFEGGAGAGGGEGLVHGHRHQGADHDNTGSGGYNMAAGVGVGVVRGVWPGGVSE